MWHVTETNRRRNVRRLEEDGWYLQREGSQHAIYRHPRIEGRIVVPRHRTLSAGVARSIARKAGWEDWQR